MKIADFVTKHIESIECSPKPSATDPNINLAMGHN